MAGFAFPGFPAWWFLVILLFRAVMKFVMRQRVGTLATRAEVVTATRRDVITFEIVPTALMRAGVSWRPIYISILCLSEF